MTVLRRAFRDPRHYQIAVLALLLGIGIFRFDFEIPLGRALLILGAALGTQAAASALRRQPFEPATGVRLDT